jgi:hypothetical protein
MIALLSNKESAIANFHYLATIDLRHATREQLSEIAAAEERWDILQNLTAFSPAFHISARILMAVFATLGLKDRAKELVQRWAKEASTLYPGLTEEAHIKVLKGEKWTAVSQLVDVCLSYLFGAHGPTDNAFQVLSDCIEAAAKEWPASINACIELLVQTADQLSVANATPLWLAVQRLRFSAMAPPESLAS